MTRQEADLNFVANYYETRLARRARFPDARRFYETELAKVVGATVIDIGCGPHLFDDVLHFGEVPAVCIGIDINKSNLDFLERSAHPKLQADRDSVRSRGTQLRLISGDLLDPDLDLGLAANTADSVVSSGCLGIFGEDDFKNALVQIRQWLKPGGRLINLGWFGNYQPHDVLASRMRTGFNLPDNPTAANLIEWAEQSGFVLVHHSIFDVPDKATYGWSAIHACCWELAMA